MLSAVPYTEGTKMLKFESSFHVCDFLWAYAVIVLWAWNRYCLYSIIYRPGDYQAVHGNVLLALPIYGPIINLIYHHERPVQNP